MDVHTQPIAVGTLLLVISAPPVQAQCLEPCKPGDANKHASFLFGPNLIVPTLCVGTPLGTLCVQ
jgi:hypothetical protein